MVEVQWDKDEDFMIFEEKQFYKIRKDMIANYRTRKGEFRGIFAKNRKRGEQREILRCIKTGFRTINPYFNILIQGTAGQIGHRSSGFINAQWVVRNDAVLPFCRV